ncbi:MAG: hypothetical protein HYS86_01580 [Candidatus Chisholmbacteria bacterium]|nr:hypothetical protein [Candidatus Chisholmbacteria bacterium]
MNSKKIALSPQSLALLKLLSKEKSLTAQQIAKELTILPQAVYRLTQKLATAGLIQPIGKYPVRFQAKNPHQAMENYLLLQRNWLNHYFAKSQSSPLPSPGPLDISFLQGKQALLDQFIKDVPLAQKEIKFIIVGLEVPPEVIYAQKQALDRGVAFKILVQYVTEKNRLMLKSWLKMGYHVRSSEPIGGHLFIFDTQIAYLGAYDPQDPTKRLVVRFANPSVAKTLNALFDDHWQKSKPITRS